MAEPAGVAGVPGRAPLSLLARTNLVLAVSALVIVVIAVAALNTFVIEPIAEQSADDEAALVVLSAQTWVELPPDARPYFELELAQNHDLIISGERMSLAEADFSRPYLSLLQDRLSERLGMPVALLEGDGLLWAEVPMGGFDIQVGFAPARRDIQPLYVGIIIVVLGALVVFLTSLFIVQRITRPLVLAAERVETFRGGENFEPLPEQGPRELVSLAHSFNTMAREISALLSNRTTLLAGISHDLRTPLTRMRLALALLPENVDPKLIERFERNLESMDALIGDALRFARGTQEQPEQVELATFIREVLAGFDQQIPLTVAGTEGLVLPLAPGALQRVLANVIGNGLQHAARVRVHLDGRRIHVLDSGPGIPADAREAVFQPFYRLDGSRNVSTGGSGLGLAIVQQLCQAQGWRVSIGDAPEGGTDICIEL
ncbi:MAG: HAMP domain-containing protein [Pseudomonadales bacterium]|nr:HAMP domain-containing protein [Pseudomonadales bacterium]